MNADQIALLNMILANPDDDTPRLIYADWLEENGEPDRADWIRYQVTGIGRHQHQHYEDASDGGVPLCVQYQCLDTQEHPLRLITGLPAFDSTMGTGHPTLGKQCTPIYRRGFVDEVRCTLGCWLEFGPEIMRWHPVLVVRVTDKSPWESAANDEPHSGWWYQHRNSGVVDRFAYCDMDTTILDLMADDTKRIKTPVDYKYPGYGGIVAFASRTDAEDALSDALIRSAKDQSKRV